MKKVIVLGDTHGRQFWKYIAYRGDWDELVLIGDYFDSFEFTGLEQMNNFQQIIDFKKRSSKPVILLIGNHDHHYFPEVGYSSTQGYQAGIAMSISHLINENRDYLQMAYSVDNMLFTHAGVSKIWMDNIIENGIFDKYPEPNALSIANWVNDLFKYKPLVFRFTGMEPTGNDKCQTPIWIRPRSLMKGAEFYKKNIIQVVGHTQQNQIDIKGKSTGKRYFFIDTLGTSGEYLVIEDNKFSTKKVC